MASNGSQGLTVYLHSSGHRSGPMCTPKAKLFLPEMSCLRPTLRVSLDLCVPLAVDVCLPWSCIPLFKPCPRREFKSMPVAHCCLFSVSSGVCGSVPDWLTFALWSVWVCFPGESGILDFMKLQGTESHQVNGSERGTNHFRSQAPHPSPSFWFPTTWIEIKKSSASTKTLTLEKTGVQCLIQRPWEHYHLLFCISPFSFDMVILPWE